MKTTIKIVFSIYFYFLCAAANANEIYNEQGVGVSINENNSCEKALLHAKNNALQSAGTIIESNFKINQSVNNGQVNKYASRYLTILLSHKYISSASRVFFFM